MFEEVGLLADSLDAQAFSPSLAHQDGIEFAALYTLQHSLAGHAEQLGCFLHDDVAIGAVRDDLLPQRIGDRHDADPSFGYAL